jgi:hypothetical protein
VYRLTDAGHDQLQAMIRDADPTLLADENEFQTRVAFFADLDPADRLKIIAVRRAVIGEMIAHLTSLRPDAVGSGWGLRVLDFGLDRFRHEQAWLDTLQAAATAEGA